MLALLPAVAWGADIPFVKVPGGCFQMGAADGQGDEKPPHRVCVGDFEMGIYEVTQWQWQSVMGNNPSKFQDCGDDCPVEKVSWTDVQSFLARLNELDPGKGYRLPTEAEWEYACRSGGREERLCGGSDEDKLARYEDNSWGMPNPVGSKARNALGLYDMSGNVWEWVSDWYGEDYYAHSPGENPQGPGEGITRVTRGGAWSVDPSFLRATVRKGIPPILKHRNLGFRLVRTAR